MTSLRKSFHPTNKAVAPGLLQQLHVSASPLQAHLQIVKGLPVSLVDQLSEASNMKPSELCRIVGVNRVTLGRRKAQTDTLTADEGARFIGFAKALESASELFGGDMNKARNWLASPAKGLAGETPLNMLTTPSGVEAVLDLIGQIKYGVIV
jgi:putative toxin-antitoxin system antitoxin component (TIGR02293 family)